MYYHFIVGIRRAVSFQLRPADDITPLLYYLLKPLLLLGLEFCFNWQTQLCLPGPLISTLLIRYPSSGRIRRSSCGVIFLMIRLPGVWISASLPKSSFSLVSLSLSLLSVSDCVMVSVPAVCLRLCDCLCPCCLSQTV